MNKSTGKIEAAIYQKLYEEYSYLTERILKRLISAVSVYDSKKDAEEFKTSILNILDRDKWEYIGLQSKVDQKVVEMLEELLKAGQQPG